MEVKRKIHLNKLNKLKKDAKMMIEFKIVDLDDFVSESKKHITSNKKESKTKRARFANGKK